MKIKDLKNLVKKDSEPYWLARIFTRYVSVYISWICIQFGISANAITIISFFIGVAGAFMFMIYDYEIYIFAFMCLLIWYILDHVDGELARYQVKVLGEKPNNSGEYLDLLVHKWVQPLTHISIGIALQSQFDSIFYLIIGIIASTSYVGWTRSTSITILFRDLVNKKISVDNEIIIRLAKLSSLRPEVEKNKAFIEKLVEIGKSVKLIFSYPGFMLFIAVMIPMEFSLYESSFGIYGIMITPLTMYLLITCLVGISQNVYGTWYIFKNMKEIPLIKSTE